ncbi:hypothetical protein HZA73_02200 [candidate division TA06 bacterium]|nr:hypothetical protein [candidate division TA06 bacterium]
MPLGFNSGSKKWVSVPAFGVIPGIDYTNDDHSYLDSISKQVSVLYHIDDDNYAIELITDSPNDELILAKLKPGKSLKTTLEKIENNIRSHKISILKDKEVLKIPYVYFDINHSFSQLIDLAILNKGWNGYYISKAHQKLRFQLNETGALMTSEAKLKLYTLGIPIEPVRPRKFIFDKPFLIMMRKKGSQWPYFAMWVGNTELLGKY